MSLTLSQTTTQPARRSWTVEELAALTPEEVALAIALKQFQGVPIPVVGGAAPAALPSARIASTAAEVRPIPKPGELKLPEALANTRKRCPKCGQTKQAERDFGPRMTPSGKVVIQSYCRKCRGSPQKINKPIK